MRLLIVLCLPVATVATISQPSIAEICILVDISSETMRHAKDYGLSRDAYYLIVQNGDSRKEVIALHCA